jgi:hypothetical protein
MGSANEKKPRRIVALGKLAVEAWLGSSSSRARQRLRSSRFSIQFSLVKLQLRAGEIANDFKEMYERRKTRMR